jgi:catechol 2,3-dioxygenase-like lactoylglutathione lyase family enzyme
LREDFMAGRGSFLRRRNDDLQQAGAVLRERGVPTRGPIFHDWMPGTSLYFEDLDGHELELFAPAT